ncbi:tRNA uridine-5-carboxymethylaminomethyl(34) synthesis GTPase MnmE [Bradyrhizobium sp. U87765 SZCCT0131]|uniref:tRNA uridine-5-carboxymethylaminomethyl(34) synthesis GTPase MnmE n=1 Tax=unclassified Bradyrhizobium TaxID=2631580 RepID=UPI001BAA3F63|nr:MULTISPECIES: tRNA uridine-5-carboxymethylaminomethyl(34) synthesis GTPase MnmE [unclassified Bradyrhizobium]MBR1216821.1 tRNA uridine-5-carboxymethylaminomethyl(34) synthesis GTPase MnmE [Bradyrhizobium sp. U87765 SZCCT0131]MBR1259423.1 tRNA uridine-5-carboxymethylaminomethyl(34) synthesis GTPase MnmE [Bradyrhizobium sp. U87765 SZCCT0134]MBR1305564.1 tRNA uridine-5-carboxymethylaminomethyl(34) synthesis GTPase MnmE [Bradyrhizobium sp. U87765 SZCCT0110]MBR1321931.1 tRNA uridine-5-carboxymeth
MDFRDQTIFALSSGRAPSAIAVVRISGLRAAAALERLCIRRPMPRVATLATLRDASAQPIDEAVVVWFPGPHSATGEDVVELHVHGGRAVLAMLFEVLGAMDGLRPADPGEFTRRAFENGKIDLTEAEGIDDLIHADTDRQRRQALRQIKGQLGIQAETWRQQIIEASALIEAGIDFSDEGDVPDSLTAPAFARIAALKAEIEAALAASARSERLREGLVVAIAGPPNAGKSTLLNRLARRDAAIVSPHAGTTRDVIEVHLDLDGYPVTLLDTAGVRETEDPVEQEGVRRAKDRAATADLVLWMTDAGDGSPHDVPDGAGDAPVWRVRNKVDLAGSNVVGIAGSGVFDISAGRGDGLSDLTAALIGFAQSYFGGSEAALVTRTRHRLLLQDTLVGLGRALAARELGDELIAEELRLAARALGRITGRVDVEDLLDVIFRDFCIGK